MARAWKLSREPWPMPASGPPDRMPEMAGEALKEATITLWRDLWQSREALERENWSLRQQVEKLTKQRDRALTRAKRGPR